MKKFIVLKGSALPGSVICEYVIHDIVNFEEDNTQKYMRKFSYRTFYEMGANPREMRKEVSHFRKNIELNGGILLTRNPIDVFQHTKTFLMFVPMKDIVDFKT